MTVKRLWRDEELIGIKDTIVALRRVRTAATQNGFLSRLLRTDKEGLRQEALSDAEKLADAAADFFAARLTDVSRKSEFQNWMDLLSFNAEKYSRYGSSTYAKTQWVEVGTFLISTLRGMSIDPEYVLDLALIKSNNLGAGSISELLSQNLGIFAPLSGDYLTASSLNAYLRRTRRGPLQIRVAGLSRNLSFGILPRDIEGGFPFQDTEALAVFTDVNETGNTARALSKLIQTNYPSKNIHQPKTDNVEWQQSEKMKKFWENAS